MSIAVVALNPAPQVLEAHHRGAFGDRVGGGGALRQQGNHVGVLQQQRPEAPGEGDHPVAPLRGLIGGHGDVGQHPLDDAVEEVLLVLDVPVERHGLDAEFGGHRTHRAGVEAAAVDDGERGLEHGVAREWWTVFRGDVTTLPQPPDVP